MTKLITFPRKVRKAHSGNAASILDKLDGYLNSNKGWQAEILYSCWDDQKNAITYSELREAVSSGVLSKEMIENWQHDYSVLVSEKLTGLWENAIKAGAAGQPIFDSMSFSVNTQAPGVTAWIRERGAQFVTASTEEQKKAIASLLIQKNSGKYTVDELARLIRPTIGLTEGAAKATARVYDNVLKTLKEEHPKMKAETARRKALDSAQKYAERAHRQRAQTIAQTEAAFAYNRGADFGVRQAQEKGLLGYCVKVWVTSGDDAVCATCASLEGTEIGVDDSFGYGGKTLFEGQHLLPPAHPRCACAVEYVEKESPLFSQMASAEEDMYEEDWIASAISEPEEYKRHFEGQMLSKETYIDAAEKMAELGMLPENAADLVNMVDSVNRYTGGGFTDILAAEANFGGRFAEYSRYMDAEERAEAIKHAMNISEFLESMPGEGGTVYRGLGFDVGGEYEELEEAYRSFRSMYKEGAVVQTDTTTSWTTDKSLLNQVHEYRTGVDESAECSVEVTIRMKECGSGVNISNYSQVEGQKEVLFEKGTKLKVTSVKETLKETWRDHDILSVLIEVEEVW